MAPNVRRKDGRICICLPSTATWEYYSDAFPRGLPDQITDYDDARMGMIWYEKHGAVATRCGQIGLFDLLSSDAVTCLACLSYP